MNQKAKCIKVNACWSGARLPKGRVRQRDTGDQYDWEWVNGELVGTPEDTLSMFKFILNKESELDYGYPMDICFINSLVPQRPRNECTDLLNSYNGKLTPNGKITVLHKINDGYSFSSFNYIYDVFKNLQGVEV